MVNYLDMGGLAAILGAFLVVSVIIGLGMYIYFALTLMNVAKRTKTENAWLAWIPIANLYLMSRIAKKHWWPILLPIGAIIPIVGFIAVIAFAVFALIWQWKICEVRGKPGWWAILQLIPFVGFVWSIIMWGILAWGE